MKKEKELARFELCRPLSAEGGGLVSVIVVETHYAARARMSRPVIVYRYYVERLTGDAKRAPAKVKSERAPIPRRAAVLLGFKG